MPKRIRDQDKLPATITLMEEHNLNLLKTLHELKQKSEGLDSLYREIYYELRSTNDNQLRVE